jgi:hypothetical protein
MVAMMEEAVDEGGCAMAGCRVHYQARWFINGNQMVVFKNYIQRERFRLKLGGWRRRNRDQNPIFRPEPVARLLWLFIYQNAVVID